MLDGVCGGAFTELCFSASLVRVSILYSLVYFAVLVGSGIFVFKSFGMNREVDPPINIRLSILMLSVSLVVAGILILFIGDQEIFYVSVLAIPYVIAIITAIIGFFVGKNKFLVVAAASGLLLMLISIAVGVDLQYAPSFFMLGLLLGGLYLFGRHWLYMFVPVLVVDVVIGVVFPVFMLVVIESSLLVGSLILFYGLYVEGKKISGEYRLDEVRRKVTHLLAFIIYIPVMLSSYLIDVMNVVVSPFGVSVFSPRNIVSYTVITLGVSVIPTFLVVEYLRIRKGSLLIPPDLLRSHEKDTIAAYIYTITGIFIVALLFPQDVLLVSVVVGLIADAMAAIVGVYFGKHKITRSRTLEGTIAGFLTAFLIVAFLTMNLYAATLVGSLISLFDVSNIYEINDNLVFPLLTAVGLTL